MVYPEHIEEVRRAVAACGRHVDIVAAVKMQTKDTVDELMRLAPDFILGENRVQELTAKYDPSYRWHFIGRLQTNKVKYIIDKVELIHSLDRAELAKEIEKQAAKHGKVQDCLVEVNMGSEVSKGVASVSLKSGIPVMFGVLTTDSIEQAIERAGTKAGNKGAECAQGAIEMVNLLREIEA